MGRSPCCSKEGLNRGAWTALEDKILTDYIKIHGEGRWRNLPKRAGLRRCGKGCRLRWLNYLRPDIKRGNISHDEEELIIRLHRLLGNRWSLIAGRLPGRTDNEIKNYWNTHLRKKVQGHPTSIRKYSNQSMEKPMSKKMGSHVIRTKALRCTTGFFTPQQHEIEHLHNKLAVGRPSMVLDMRNHIVVEQESCVVPSLIAPEEDNLSNFMLDFNVDEFFQSNILDTDFSELCYSNNGILRDHKKDTSNDLTLYIDQPFMFYEEMLKDWTGSDYINSTQLSFGSPIVSYF